jgi:hypothetical protein
MPLTNQGFADLLPLDSTGLANLGNSVRSFLDPKTDNLGAQVLAVNAVVG